MSYDKSSKGAGPKDNSDSIKGGPVDSAVKLEEKCETCNGAGFYLNDRCPECEGRGATLTEFGEEVLCFVSRRLKLAAG